METSSVVCFPPPWASSTLLSSRLLPSFSCLHLVEHLATHELAKASSVVNREVSWGQSSPLPWWLPPAPAALLLAPLQRCRGQSTFLCGAASLPESASRKAPTPTGSSDRLGDPWGCSPPHAPRPTPRLHSPSPTPGRLLRPTPQLEGRPRDARRRGLGWGWGAGGWREAEWGAPALARLAAPRGICRPQLQQLRRWEEGWRAVRRAGARASREGGREAVPGESEGCSALPRPPSGGQDADSETGAAGLRRRQGSCSARGSVSVSPERGGAGEAEAEEEAEEGENARSRRRCRRRRRDAPGSGGCQAVPHQLCAELAGHRRAVGHLHHLLCHRQRGVLHPALLDRRRRGHPASRLFRALPLLHRQRLLPGADLQGQLHGLLHAALGRLQSRLLLHRPLHDAHHRLHHLLYPLLLLQHGYRVQDLCLDAAHLRWVRAHLRGGGGPRGASGRTGAVRAAGRPQLNRLGRGAWGREPWEAGSSGVPQLRAFENLPSAGTPPKGVRRRQGGCWAESAPN